MKNNCNKIAFCALLSAGNVGVLSGNDARGAGWPSVDAALHVNAVIGKSSADSPGEFFPGAHDPKRNERLELQSLHPSISLRWGKHLEGFVTGMVFTDEDGDFDWEWEEIFGKIKDIPGGFELRGGRFLNRVGLQNPLHQHSWETVDSPLVNALLLGDHGLATIGGEINWHLPTAWRSVLTISYGEAPSHGHGHHGHGHHHGTDLEAFEELQLHDRFFTAAGRTAWQYNDFQRLTFALGAGWGENEEEGDAWFGLAGAEYSWRENGLEPGGREFLWRTELIYLSTEVEEHHHGHGHHGHDFEREDIWGLSSVVAYQANDWLRPFARIDFVDSFEPADLPSWTRYTVGSTFFITSDPTTYLRLQANFDERGSASEQSIWLQFGFSFGGPEVR